MKELFPSPAKPSCAIQDVQCEDDETAEEVIPPTTTWTAIECELPYRTVGCQVLIVRLIIFNLYMSYIRPGAGHIVCYIANANNNYNSNLTSYLGYIA